MPGSVNLVYSPTNGASVPFRRMTCSSSGESGLNLRPVASGPSCSADGMPAAPVGRLICDRLVVRSPDCDDELPAPLHPATARPNPIKARPARRWIILPLLDIRTLSPATSPSRTCQVGQDHERFHARLLLPY